MGRDAARQFFLVYARAFPDLHFDIEQMLTAGDFVVVRWTATGTHRGDLMGLPPTNKRAVTSGCSVMEYKNSRPSHDRIYWDSGNLLRQLGVPNAGFSDVAFPLLRRQLADGVKE